MTPPPRLGVGFIGSGFNARFHIKSWTGVRDADVLGVFSPNSAHAEGAAALARSLNVGEAKTYSSIADMVEDPGIGAIWLCGPNQARIQNVEEIVETLNKGRGELKGVACEKPLARTVSEARQVAELIRSAGLNHGYLENQLFTPHVVRGRELIWARGAALTGRPYLARAAEEHSGPHMPWFWRADLQGGGVLNDMMCHSVEVVRHLLTEPGAPRSSIRPVKITAHIASLKWTRPEYAKKLSRMMGEDVDYTKRPAEDFANATIEYETNDGMPLLGEVTTSWGFVGAGLRLSAELLGPEYSMSWNTLESGLKLFFSREVRGESGEDLVEKQNAEMGLMPVVPDEWTAYGYEAENRHFTQAFLKGETPSLTFDDGVEVMRVLMASYMSAEQGRTLDFPPDDLDEFIPAVARGEWRGK
jgi:predicted dehydrogenase